MKGKLIVGLCVVLAILIVLITRVLHLAAAMTKAAVFLMGILVLLVFLSIRFRE